MLAASFFDRDACTLARDLVGKVLRRRLDGVWLSAAVVEAEAYYRAEKGSHASLGRTPSRESLFAPAGTLYLYHSRAGDSLNVSARGDGNAVLIKSGRPFFDRRSPRRTLDVMQRNNPRRDGGAREEERQCAGQTLLCRSLALKIADWDGRAFDRRSFFLEDVGYTPATVLVARRLGIPEGRDGHLLYRYLDEAHAASATEDPRRKRANEEGRDWLRLPAGAPDPNAGGPADSK